MDLTDGLLPVSLDPPAGRIALRPLARHGFHEPWFDYAHREASEPPRTRPLADLLGWAEADRARSAPPRTVRLIAHTTRCGSTMLANQLSLRPGTLVLKEPLFLLDAALHALRARHPDERRAALELVRALLAYCDATAEAHGRRLVVKLTSWTALVVLRALGGRTGPAHWLLVWRDPAEVVASAKGSPPSWGALRSDPALRAALGLGPPRGGGAEGDVVFHAHLWRALVEAFTGPPPRAGHETPLRTLDYATLTADSAGALLAAEGWLGVGGTDDLPDGFADLCGRYAKSADGEPFDPSGAHHRPALGPAERSVVRGITDPALPRLRAAVPLLTAEGARWRASAGRAPRPRTGRYGAG